jgi:hypothetical protein
VVDEADFILEDENMFKEFSLIFNYFVNFIDKILMKGRRVDSQAKANLEFLKKQQKVQFLFFSATYSNLAKSAL